MVFPSRWLALNYRNAHLGWIFLEPLKNISKPVVESMANDSHLNFVILWQYFIEDYEFINTANIFINRLIPFIEDNNNG